MLHLNNVLVVGGEDKPQRHLMYQAVQEDSLLDKHKGASAALYGDLGYLILFATAADAVRVFALELCPGAMLQPLMQEFMVRHRTMFGGSADCGQVRATACYQVIHQPDSVAQDGSFSALAATSTSSSTPGAVLQGFALSW